MTESRMPKNESKFRDDSLKDEALTTLPKLEDIVEVPQGDGTKLIEFHLRFEPTNVVRKRVPLDFNIKAYQRAGYNVKEVEVPTEFTHYVSR